LNTLKLNIGLSIAESEKKLNMNEIGCGTAVENLSKTQTAWVAEVYKTKNN